MQHSRKRSPNKQPATEHKVVTEPMFEEPAYTGEHVSDPHGTVALLLMLLLMLLLVLLVIAIAQSV
jgi:hypothetical protein